MFLKISDGTELLTVDHIASLKVGHHPNNLEVRGEPAPRGHRHRGRPGPDERARRR
jgi:hypothetical protein